MHRKAIKILIVMMVALLTLSSSAQAPVPEPETIHVDASDGLVLVGDVYHPESSPESGSPALLLLHMLGSNRQAYDPLIPDLVDNGYVVLNVDMRGHGDTGGARNWDLTLEDTQLWLDWLRSVDRVDPAKVAIIGGSIGSNVALMACAADADCVTAIALSPGLDYDGVQPETAVTDGLSDRSALLIASHGDRYSADSVGQMFVGAKGTIAARLYAGNSHGTNLFRTDYASIRTVILAWLDEHLGMD